MRTVHETEALRPSDPVPKSLQSTSGPSKLKPKIILKTSQSHAHDDSMDEGGHGADSDTDLYTPLTEDRGFTLKEIAMPLERLHKLCRLQVKWAEKENEELLGECKHWEAVYKQEWLEKEVLLDQVVSSEQNHHNRRMAVLSGKIDIKVPATVTNDAVEIDVDMVAEPPTNGKAISVEAD